MNFMIFELIDWLGILGSLILAAAYFAVSNKIVNPDRPAYHSLNLIGSILILFSLYFKPNAGAILVEILWLMIACFALIKFFLHK